MTPMFLSATSPFKLLFVGDSITDCGRDRSQHGSDLGNGYVQQVDALLRAHLPQLAIQTLNVGVSGDRVTDLEARWQEDVLHQSPDYVAILIGINDVWRQFDAPHLPPVTLEAYAETLEALIRRTRCSTQGMWVLSPFFLETNKADPMRAMMDRYGAAAQAVAKAQGLSFVDLQAAFDAWLSHQPTQQLCADRVHPNAVGHAIIARAFLRALGFNWT
ncbi:MAG: SGNH/GDSL hydrolase family protein [Opitutales bacterium]